MGFKGIVLLVLVLVLVIVFIQNRQVVDMHILFWAFSMSRIILLFFSMLVGVVMGYILGVSHRKRREQA